MDQERDDYADSVPPSRWLPAWVWELLAVLIIAVGVAVAVVLYFHDSNPPASAPAGPAIL